MGIDRIEIKQLDTSRTTREGIKIVEEDLNGFVERLEKGGFLIIDEEFLPQTNAIRTLLKLTLEKSTNPLPTRYAYMICDSRNGHDIAAKEINTKIIELKKNNTILREFLVPMRNDAFVQELICYRPKTKKAVILEVKK